MKCKCGVELFDGDVVKAEHVIVSFSVSSTDDFDTVEPKSYIYRCPKCFKVKKVKV